MIKYSRVLLAVANEVWALDHGKLQAMAQVLAFQAAGGKLTASEIEARVPESRARDVVKAPGQVAVLPVYGVLAQRMNMMEDISAGGSSVEQLQAQFRGLLADDGIKAIVLNFDSPGGQASGIAEFAAEIFAARGDKPIIAQIDSTAASAAYWLAAAADEVVMTPGGRVGSVGVYSVHEEMSKALEANGVTTTLVSSGGLKGAINDFQPLTEEARAELQKHVDYLDAMFVKALASYRGISQAQVKDRFGSGKTFRAEDAVKRGMVDRIAPLSETLARFGAQAPMIKRRQAAGAVRAAAATGDFSDISPSVLEDGLREALGLSKSQAAVLASSGLKLLRQGEPGEDRGDPGAAAKPSAAASLIEAIQRSASAYKPHG